jgi:hypothetical protein
MEPARLIVCGPSSLEWKLTDTFAFPTALTLAQSGSIYVVPPFCTVMADTQGTATDTDDRTDVKSPEELAVTVLVDGVIGAVAGLGGNLVILGTLFVAAQLGGFDLAAFATAAGLLGLGAVLTEPQLLVAGLAIFVVGGMTTLPLLLATLGAYLPGRRYAEKGLVFGAVMWTGFVLAYYPGYSGVSLAVYVTASLVGHLGYGYVTGHLMDRLFAGRGRPVIATRNGSPAALTEQSADPDATTPRQETTLVDESDEA